MGHGNRIVAVIKETLTAHDASHEQMPGSRRGTAPTITESGSENCFSGLVELHTRPSPASSTRRAPRKATR